MSDFKKYQCRECEHICDEAKADRNVIGVSDSS